MSRVFEKGYNLVLNRAYKVVRIASTSALFTVYPLLLYLLTLNIELALVLPLLYLSSSLLLYVSYWYCGNGFGRSRFARSLSISIPSISSLADLMLSILVKKVIALVSLVAFSGLHTSIISISSMDDKRSRKIFKMLAPCVSLLPPQAVASSVLNIPFRFYIILDCAVYGSSIISTYLMMRFLERKSSSFMVKLLSSFFEAFGNNVRAFEKTLREISTYVETKIHVIGIETENDGRCVITIPYLHFGPISGTIGSRLLYEVTNAVRRGSGGDVVYLHGVGSHELDVLDENSCREIIRKLESECRRLFDECRSTMSLVKGLPEIVEGSLIRLVKIPIGPVNIVLVSKKRGATDDIPLEVYEQIRKEVPLRNIVLVDSQNSYDGDSTWSSDEIRELKNLLRRLIDSNSKLCVVHASWRTLKNIDGVYPDEIGPEGAHVLYLRYSSKIETRDLVLVSFDSNNMTRNLRETLIRRLSRDNRIVEIVTMDDHELVKFVSGRGYAILGEKSNIEKICSHIEKVVNDLERSLSRVKCIVYRRVNVRPRVLGVEGFNHLKEKLNNCIRHYRRFLMYVMGIPAVTTLTIVLIGIALSLI
ncbi:MAG: DUF2070 family protein [Crenarchaeota archaeon]|nr:DUF2070 family protein [Thermoproteota archaeon]